VEGPKTSGVLQVTTTSAGKPAKCPEGRLVARTGSPRAEDKKPPPRIASTDATCELEVEARNHQRVKVPNSPRVHDVVQLRKGADPARPPKRVRQQSLCPSYALARVGSPQGTETRRCELSDDAHAVTKEEPVYGELRVHQRRRYGTAHTKAD
jgi:hypothetical protein